jgi:hypothetical protein
LKAEKCNGSVSTSVPSRSNITARIIFDAEVIVSVVVARVPDTTHP